MLVTLKHQTTNSIFPNFISPNFFRDIFSAGLVEEFVFFLNCSNWEKFVEKIGENKIRGLVVWCHEQDTVFNDWKILYNEIRNLLQDSLILIGIRCEKINRITLPFLMMTFWQISEGFFFEEQFSSSQGHHRQFTKQLPVAQFISLKLKYCK